MCKHRVRFVQYAGERNGKASSRKHWNSYDVRIRSTSRAVFFLKLSCLSGCFDRILLLSASSGYHTLSEGTLRIPNRRCSRYPHAGRQNAVYCQTLERLLIIKERKILQVEVPASYIQTFRCFLEEAFSSSSPPAQPYPPYTTHRKEHTMLWDTHMHTAFSTDSETSPESMIKASIELGLGGICITDHMDYDYPKEHPEDEPEFILDTPVYFPTIQKLGQQYKDKIKVLTGIELGLQPHLAAKHQELISRYDFDFVIGSSHVIHGKDPYYSRFFEGKTEQQAYQEYFESILENLAVFDNFDVYGHIDYVVRYGPNRNLKYSYQKYADVIDAILEKLIDIGKGIEINTGGFKYGLGHPNPTEDIIKRYHELGGEIITIGADAHKPEHVAFDFAKVPDILKAAGFQYFTVFEKRKPAFLPL